MAQALTEIQKQMLRDTAAAAPGPQLVFARYRKKVLVRAGDTRWETPETIDELLALESAGLVRRIDAPMELIKPKSMLTTGFLENPKEFAFFELTEEGEKVFRLKLLARLVTVMIVVGAILFGCAGRIDLPFFWAYLALLAALGVFTIATVSKELLEERYQSSERGRDNIALVRLAALVSFLGQWIVAGLDVRFHWSAPIPPALRLFGLAALFAVLAVWYWAMKTNPFFSAAVRVQRERGHHVVSSGPYRFVRHPGYAAFVLLGWGGGVALGSWWAAAMHGIIVLLFVRRAALEDAMLRAELDGYAAYAERVRYRFAPGIW